MAAAHDDVTAEMLRHPRGWFVVRLVLPLIGQLPWDLFLMLNTGRPYSAISPATYIRLADLGLVAPRAGSRVVIRNARLGGAPLHDISMRVSAGPALLGMEGMLGLDFFEQFAEARFDFQALRLTLVRA
jgi:hypothetical protein